MKAMKPKTFTTEAMIILLHSSKTMRSPDPGDIPLRQPLLIKQAAQLDAHLKTLPPEQLAKSMHISLPLAAKTQALIKSWRPQGTSLAIDSFVGDIYSGLRASKLTAADREYADQTLRILSGLYGILRPFDAIYPYRLEMGYRLQGVFANLYTYWGEGIAACLPATGAIINLSSIEYSQTITPFVDPARMITPKFLTANPQTGEPSFVVVHAKIARGAFAHWLITSRITDSIRFAEFSDIGYRFSKELSTPDSPTFICRTFGGKGLSMRLS
jgi:cytoplasmic iron level regulating protein YaaA (DUF328/UPF0246 family)